MVSLTDTEFLASTVAHWTPQGPDRSRTCIISHPEIYTPRRVGYNNPCLLFPDVISVNGAVADGQLAQRYEDSGDGDGSINPGTYGAAVYRPADNASRFYTTLITGYQVPNLLGVGFEETSDDKGRQAFVSDADADRSWRVLLSAECS